jgi:hypothetical protein
MGKTMEDGRDECRIDGGDGSGTFVGRGSFHGSSDATGSFKGNGFGAAGFPYIVVGDMVEGTEDSGGSGISGYLQRNIGDRVEQVGLHHTSEADDGEAGLNEDGRDEPGLEGMSTGEGGG